ncbi:MAG: site-specific DNA-methyltransferase [Akkermansia sp.]|nr:site-specific DNA-methyltransferase [Akkermansia sp.]
MESPDGDQLNIDKIASIFPQAVTETLVDGKPKKVVDFDKLRQLLSSDVLEGDEAYEFTWVGKRAAIAEANRPIRKTLRPCPDESKDWDTTQNLYIEGDNLEVLKLLQENYMGKVKMIYIDPPYNTGSDLIYKDDFHLSTDEYDDSTKVFDEDGDRLFKNTDSNGRFHSDWCSYMYSRLLISRSLLKEDGVIFISIDDHEIQNAINIANEVYGEHNKVACFVVVRAEGGGLAKQAIIGHDYLLAFAKNINAFQPLGKPKDIRGEIVDIDGVKYWTETDWLRKEFGKYGTCLYEEIAVYHGDEKLKEINEGIADGKYVLIKRNDGHVVGRYRRVDTDFTKFYSILKHLNKKGKEDLEQLGLGDCFDYPKPVSLLQEIIIGATIRTKSQEDIVLDFYSGSAAAAHATLLANHNDGGNRRFIMVQLNEPCPEASVAYASGFRTICDIGKERIRRAGEAIKQEAGLAGQTLDIGFRVFKVDESNMEDIYYTPGETTQEKLREQKENIKGDRSALDLFFGCILDWGLPLSLPYTCEEIEGCTVHTYNDGDLVACFNENIPESVVEAIAKRKPIRAVFRDSGFADSPAKINVGERFKLISPDTTVKVI